MKISKIMTILLACVVVSTAGCTSGEKEEATLPTTQSLGYARPREGDDAYAIDKLNVDPLPGDAKYTRKFTEQLEIVAGEWDCNIGGSNYKDQYQALDIYAEALMASYVITFKYQTSDVIWEDPVHTTVAGYDAVLYNFVIEETLWETDANESGITDVNGDYISYAGRHFNGRAYFFFSGTDAYYMIFTCLTEDYAECAPEWDTLIDNVKIDEDLKLSDVTTISAALTVTQPVYDETAQ
jgi:hypothetical protein